jgi:hypothetical protein
MDAAAALLEGGDTKTALPFLASTQKSVEVMADGYWKARAYGDLGKLASLMDDRKTSDHALHLANTIAGRLNEEEKKLWKHYSDPSASPVASKTGPASLSPEQVKAAEKKKERVEKWTKFIDSQYELNKPLYLDLQGHIQTLGTKPKPWDIFNGLTETVENIAEMLRKIRKMESQN